MYSPNEWMDFLSALGGHGTEEIDDFGDWHQEVEAWRQDAVIFDLSHRDGLSVSGSDSAAFMSRLVTYAIDRLTPGTGCRPFILDSRGRIQVTFNCYCVSGSDFLIECEAQTTERLKTTLDMYHFGEDFQLEDDSRVALGVAGPKLSEILAPLGIELPAAPWGHRPAIFAQDDVYVCSDPRLGSGAFSIWSDRATRRRLWEAMQASGAVPSGKRALELMRIASGWAGVPNEFSDSYTPLDLGAMDGLTDGKGCYPGQEVIERTIAIGRPAYFLARLKSVEPLAIGQKVLLDEKNVGEITSAAQDPDGHWVALAALRTRYKAAHGFRVEGHTVEKFE